MKICYYNHTGHVSGAERVLFMAMGGVDRQEHDVMLVAPDSPAMLSFCEGQGIQLRPAPELSARFTYRPDRLLFYLWSVLKLVARLRSIIKRERPDVIHANSTRAGIVAAIASIGMSMPVLWHIHDVLPRHVVSSAIRMLALLSGRNQIIAVSQATAEGFQAKLLRRFSKRVPVRVVHNGIDVHSARSLPAEAAEFLKSQGINETDFRIGIVGQIAPRKGHLGLIRALAALCASDLPNARLLVVGAAIFNRDSEYLALVKQEAERLGVAKHVLFLGHRSDVATVLQSLDVLVLNSSSEPFSIVLLEALANGIPVIATRVDGVPELIINDVCGKLFDVGDEGALKHALRTVACNRELAHQMGTAGRERVASHFSREIFVTKVCNLYADLQPNSVKERATESPAMETKC